MNSQTRSARPAPPTRPAKTASPAIRILLADDHPVVRIGVRNMLQSEPGLEVVGECSDGDEAITQTLELLPDILLLDVYMPRLPGLEAMRAIMSGSPSRQDHPAHQHHHHPADHRGAADRRPRHRH